MDVGKQYSLRPPTLGEEDHDLIRVIRPDGSVDPQHDPDISVERVVEIYKAMVRTRFVDQRLEKLQRQGRIAFHVGSLGEEAAVVAPVSALREQDWIVPCYREVGALLFRGYPLQRYIDHMFGNAGDPVVGRQMPDHTVSREHRYLSVSAPIGTQIPHAVGLAWAAKKRGLDEVAIVYFGEGATSSNGFHSAMNFAGVYKVPVVFLCRNNRWAISLPSERQTASRTFADKAIAYGMRSARVDGNDALAVMKTVQAAVEHAASGKGPTLVEMVTYRLGGHSTSDDPNAYRKPEEVEVWDAMDPIPRLRSYLERKGGWDQAQDQAWLASVEAELRECIFEAEAKGPPELSTMFEEVYAEMPWHLEAERDECLEIAEHSDVHLASEDDDE